VFAVIATNGFQYIVSKGEKIVIPARVSEVGKKIAFDKVLLIKDNGSTIIGKPYVTGAQVEGIVRIQGKMPKKIVYKFKRRLKYRRKKGHRQDYSEVEITDIKKGGRSGS